MELNELVSKEYGNVLMREESKGEDRVQIRVIPKRRLAVNKSRTACINLLREAELKNIEQEVRAECQDMFSNEVPKKMPLADSPKHYIVFKDEKKVIKGRMMRILNKYIKFSSNRLMSILKQVSFCHPRVVFHQLHSQFL